MSKILPGGRYSAFSAQLTATAPRLTGCHAQHWAMIHQRTVRPIAN